MIALVTGSTGFIGSFLTEKLVEEGWEVFCLVRKTSSLKYIENLPVKFIYGDFSSLEVLSGVLPSVTHVFHIAGANKAVKPEGYMNANGLNTCKLLDACVRHAKRLKRFVALSSLAVAGPSPDGSPRHEDDSPQPISIYGRSKLEGELCCAKFKSKLPITIIRAPIVFGPRGYSLHRYLIPLKRGIHLRFSPHSNLISMIHVKDLVRGILTAASHPNSLGETYFIANPEPYSWSRLFDSIARFVDGKRVSITVPLWIFAIVAAMYEVSSRISGKPGLLNFDKLGEIRARYWVCSTEKIRQQLGFSTSMSLEEGLRQTIDWYFENGWL